MPYNPGYLLAANNLSDLANAQTAMDNLTNNAVVTGIKLAVTATLGLALFNTADQVTNTERLREYWTGNVAAIGIEVAGTGTPRRLSLFSATTSLTGNRNAFQVLPPLTTSGTAGYFQADNTGVINIGNTVFFNIANIGGNGYTNTSGQSAFLQLSPIYNQSSGTAANTDFLINRTQTAVGSGAQLLADFQVGGVSQFNVTNAGNVGALGNFTAGSNARFQWASRSIIYCPSDGIIQLIDSSTTNFARLQFGGSTSSFPAIKRNAAGLDLRVADDSAYAGLTVLNVVATSSILSIGPTQGVGYGTGAGGTVVQATSKVTAFTLSKVCGQITFAADALGANTTSAGATWTNTAIAAGDTVVWNHVSGGTLGAYDIIFTPAAGSCTVRIRNVTGGSLSEAPVIQFSIIKAVQA